MRARMVSVSVALCAASLACDSPTPPLPVEESPLPAEGPPDELVFGMGGYGIGGITIELKDEVVLMWHAPWEWTSGQTIDTVRTVPTSEKWRAFWIAADHAGVHRWRSRYTADNVADGMGWSLRLIAGDFTVESTGSNAYPDSLGGEHELEMPPEFGALLRALGNLVGQAL